MMTMTNSNPDRKHPHAHCETCPLNEIGKFVPSTMPISHIPMSNHGKKIAIVGESPGKQEVWKGKVFIGPSGKVLDAVMKNHGIDRAQCLMTNSIACHYPDDAFSTPPKEAMEACRPRLLAEIEETGTDTVITVGAVAAKSMINIQTGITKLRGGGPRLSSYALSDGSLLTVIPTYHPAYAMRDQTKFPDIVRDFGKVKPGGVWGTWSDPDFEVVSNTAIATKYINWMLSGRYRGPIVVDTESGADKDDAFGGAIKEALCVGVWYEDGNKALVFTPSAMNRYNRRLLGQLMMDRGIVTQNGKYDVSRCLNVYLGGRDTPLDIFVAFDTMLASYCLNEGKGIHGLEYMGMEYLGTADWKSVIEVSMEEGRRKKRAEYKAKGLPIKGLFTGLDYSLVDPPVLYKYNACDVFVTRKLWEFFKPLLVDGAVDELNSWLLTVSHMLVHVEQNGLPVDLDYNMELEVKFKDLLNDIDFGKAKNINPNSWQQVKKHLAGMGVQVASTNKATIKAVAEIYEGRDDVTDFCNSLLDHRAYSKLMGTYITGLRKNLVDGVVHPSFSMHTTTTGRTSARNPNSQNIPRGSDMRRQFVASVRRGSSDKGRVLIQADYGQAELRVLTWLGRDSFMRDAFNDGTQDVFDLLCGRMYGDKWELETDKAFRKEMRTLIKTFAYGIAYGREAKAIAEAFGISLALAKRQQAQFKSMIPGIMEYQQSVKDRVMNGDDLVNPFGRRRRFHLITNANVVSVMNEAMAFMPQSTASDICLEAAVRLDKQGILIRNLVHDSICAEAEESEVLDVARLLTSTMVSVAEEVTGGYVKFIADVEVGDNWADLVELKL